MTLAEQALELLKDTGNTPDEMYDFSFPAALIYKKN